MRNIALAIVVLAVTIPAMADVNITISNDVNKVTIGYECTNDEKVRAFALQIDVNEGKFVVGSAEPVGDPNHIDYYVYPGSMTFTVVSDGNTHIDDFGTPIAEQDANSGVLEMASLYADSDPNHPLAPAGANDLATFYVDTSDGNCVTVTISEDGKRGGVVLEDPNEEFVLNLPDPCVICEKCLVVGEVVGGVLITPEMYDLWVSLGEPNCWCCPCHFRGDENCDGWVDAADITGTDGIGPPIFDGWIDSFNEAYHPCSDINNDGWIDAADITGSDGIGNIIMDGWIDGWNTGCP
jgi:hypothetical protein